MGRKGRHVRLALDDFEPAITSARPRHRIHRQSRFQAVDSETHALPFHIMWVITMLTAVGMALMNFCTIWVISFIVEWKFSTMQAVIDEHGVACGVLVLAGICTTLATLCACLVAFVVPGAGGSGAPENKGWLNGNSIPGLFTYSNLIGRATATILANTTGYPVGREGPTVTMGSNLAFLITHKLTLPYVQQWISVAPGWSTALMVDEERFMHVKRIICTVGGACGMSMLFDSPIGGIVYMFEEITSASWPLELTFRAFTGTIVCALMSRFLLEINGTNVKAFVVYEWNPRAQPWSWSDMPYFLLMSAFLGPFSAFHTRACLKVAKIRQAALGRLQQKCQRYVKIADAIFYGTLCSLTYALLALMGDCKPEPGHAVEFVRYNCKEGEYNPVASLLLTTTDAAVKRLFSTQDEATIQWDNELLAFLAYTALNIGLTGVPVPSGNFTGSMLIGGLFGRIVGCGVRSLNLGGNAVSGVYAMVGSAAMLCGFKQMSVAVVIFIVGCANDLNLIPPLMLSITVSLFLNKQINERGFDEEQILRKNIPFLPAEAPPCMDHSKAIDLVEHLPPQAVLAPVAPLAAVNEALAVREALDFPVVRTGKVGQVCIGFTTRDRLEAALEARREGQEANAGPENAGASRLPRYVATLLGNQADAPSSASSASSPRSKRPTLMGRMAKNDGEDEIAQLMAGAVGEQSGSSEGGQPLPIGKLADRSPHMIVEDMPLARFYPLFSKAGVRAACIVSEDGEFRGFISRRSLIAATRAAEQASEAQDEEPSDEEEEEDDGDEDDDDEEESGDTESGAASWSSAALSGRRAG